MSVEITFKGEQQLEAALTRVLHEIVGDAAAALYQEAEIEMAEAKRRTPVDTGALRESGHVVPPEQDGADTIVVLAFGGEGAVNAHGVAVDSYAVQVHEDLEAFHPSGQAKFLESVVTESAPYLAERVAARMKAANS